MVPQFQTERETEFRRLLKNKTFLPIHESEVPESIRIFVSRFGDDLERGEMDLLMNKSRLITHNYCYNGSKDISTKAKSVHRMTQRLVVSLLSSIEDLLRTPETQTNFTSRVVPNSRGQSTSVPQLNSAYQSALS